MSMGGEWLWKVGNFFIISYIHHSLLSENMQCKSNYVYIMKPFVGIGVLGLLDILNQDISIGCHMLFCFSSCNKPGSINQYSHWWTAAYDYINVLKIFHATIMGFPVDDKHVDNRHCHVLLDLLSAMFIISLVCVPCMMIEKYFIFSKSWSIIGKSQSYGVFFCLIL